MSTINKPMGPQARTKTRDRLKDAGLVSAYNGDEIVWRDSEEKGTCWVEVIEGVEHLVVGDQHSVRVFQIPTSLLTNFIRLARLPDSGYCEESSS